MNTINEYSDGARLVTTYQEKGWGPFRSVEVEVTYTHPLDDDNNALETISVKSASTLQEAQEWAYVKGLEFRMNG